MSFQPTSLPPVPEATARVAQAAFKRKGNLYLTIGDQLGALFDDLDFACLYAADGAPALSPNLIALVTIFQFMENLPDAAAADAVRSRIDWKYALHLALDDMGFDSSVLSDFRRRLMAHGQVQTMYEQVLKRLAALGLVKKGGQQRTDSAAVLAATQVLNRVQLVAETMRLAVEALADYRPEWLRGIALPQWYERYSLVLTSFRLPRAKEKQEALALDIGRDGFHLLDALLRPDAPSLAATLPAVVILAQVWEQQFERAAAGPRWRDKAAKPPAGQVIVTPHDPEARFTAHDAHTWVGYAVHWTETCDPELPHIITHVATTGTEVRDVAMIPQIHADLQRRDLLPGAHWVDGGYLSADNVAESAANYGVRLIGPLPGNSSWQAHTRGGVTLEQFHIDHEQQQATCPQGQTSHKWRSYVAAERPVIQIEFPKAACQPCAVRELCTHSKTGVRTLTLGLHHATLQAGRRQQQTDDFAAEYTRRAGIEGTVSAMIRAHGARRTRYKGAIKTHLQNLLIAMAANLRRAALWLMGERPGTTRPASLHCLAPA